MAEQDCDGRMMAKVLATIGRQMESANPMNYDKVYGYVGETLKSIAMSVERMSCEQLNDYLKQVLDLLETTSLNDIVEGFSITE